MYAEFPITNMSHDRWGGLFPKLANDDFADADQLCEQYFVHGRCGIGHVFDEAEKTLFARLIPMIFARDRAAIATLLHELEWKTVKKLKIEKFWEKTPFPLESAHAA